MTVTFDNLDDIYDSPIRAAHARGPHTWVNDEDSFDRACLVARGTRERRQIKGHDVAGPGLLAKLAEHGIPARMTGRTLLIGVSK